MSDSNHFPDWWHESRDGGGWKAATPTERRLAFEADYAVPPSQFYGDEMSPAWWTLDDVRPEQDPRETGGES